MVNRSTRTLTLLLTVGLSAGFAACASGGAGAEGGPSRDRNLITAEELAEASFTSVLDAVSRLRPQWLRTRGGTDMQQAILDGTRLGGVDQLGSLNVVDVVSIQRLSASDATTRYGTGFTSGAILVRTR